jgi:hypothetical protein
VSRLAKARLGARFLRSLPAFLRDPVSSRDARAIQAGRIRDRASAFRAAVRRIYGHPESPYRKLLESVGCEHGDVERLVEREGVEGALRALCRRGVYLTVSEFKGREQIRRGSTVIDSGPDLLRNPAAAFHFPIRSGGSRSAGTPVLIDFAFVRGCAVSTRLLLDAWGDDGWEKAVWETVGAGARFRLLKYTAASARPSRWFSHVDPRAPGPGAMFLWSERAMRWGSRVARIPLPPPELAPVEDPLPVALWMREVLRAKGTPYLFTFPSSAVRLCSTALECGIDLTGARLLLGGEPITEARLSVVRRAGAWGLPRYGSMECGPVGYGCLAPTGADDVHLLQDMHALIQPPDDASSDALPPDALLVTSLHPRAPFMLLNVSMGDQAVMERRACGCELERLGYGVHLREIRSFEKLTGEGITLLGTDVIAVLEEMLPGRFGGAPGDYQLVEEEREDGRPRLRLLVHPGLGEMDEVALAEAFLGAIGSGSEGQRMMEKVWRDAGLLQVERRAPEPTGAGKLLHLRVGRLSASKS